VSFSHISHEPHRRELCHPLESITSDDGGGIKPARVRSPSIACMPLVFCLNGTACFPGRLERCEMRFGRCTPDRMTALPRLSPRGQEGKGPGGEDRCDEGGMPVSVESMIKGRLPMLNEKVWGELGGLSTTLFTMAHVRHSLTRLHRLRLDIKDWVWIGGRPARSPSGRALRTDRRSFATPPATGCQSRQGCSQDLPKDLAHFPRFSGAPQPSATSGVLLSSRRVTVGEAVSENQR
jgi:hypothetical protein